MAHLYNKNVTFLFLVLSMTTTSGTHLNAEESALNLKFRLSGPNWWGPIFWKALHSTAASAPEIISSEKEKEYRQYLDTFHIGLPCQSSCPKHYKAYLQSNPPQLCCKFHFFRWTVDFHNSVNERTGKQTITLDKAIELFVDDVDAANSKTRGRSDIAGNTALRVPDQPDVTIGFTQGMHWGWILATLLIILLLVFVVIVSRHRYVTKIVSTSSTEL